MHWVHLPGLKGGAMGADGGKGGGEGGGEGGGTEGGADGGSARQQLYDPPCGAGVWNMSLLGHVCPNGTCEAQSGQSGHSLPTLTHVCPRLMQHVHPVVHVETQLESRLCHPDVHSGRSRGYDNTSPVSLSAVQKTRGVPAIKLGLRLPAGSIVTPAWMISVSAGLDTVEVASHVPSGGEKGGGAGLGAVGGLSGASHQQMRYWPAPLLTQL